MLFALYEDGIVDIRHSKSLNPQDLIMTGHKITTMKYRTCQNELFMGTDDGHIIVYSMQQKLPVYVFKAHISEINCIEFIESRSQLITGANDKHYTVWRYPDYI